MHKTLLGGKKALLSKRQKPMQKNDEFLYKKFSMLFTFSSIYVIIYSNLHIAL